MSDLEIARFRVEQADRYRRLSVAEASRGGMTIRAIGEALGLGKSRVQQILAEGPEIDEAGPMRVQETGQMRVQESGHASAGNDPLPPWRNQPFTPDRIRVIAEVDGVEVLARARSDVDLAAVLRALRAAVGRIEGGGP